MPAKVWAPVDPSNIFTEEGFWRFCNNVYADEHQMAVQRLGRITANGAVVLRELAFKFTTLSILSHSSPAGNA